MTRLRDRHDRPLMKCSNRFCGIYSLGTKDEPARCPACNAPLRPPEGPPPGSPSARKAA